MANDKFEGWCTPVSFGDREMGKYADHTFVYCPTHDASFKCWGTANRDGKNAAKVCSKSDKKAYCRASKYRISLGPCKDTAGVGIYALNGVCHQSANLFLHSAGTCLPLNKSRPKGILASHALYGMYGADSPGNLPSFATHYFGWQIAIYKPASIRCWSLPHFHWPKFKGMTPGSQQDLVDKVTRLHLEQQGVTAVDGSNKKQSSNIVPQEMQLLLSHYLPGVDNSIVRKVHDEIMDKKEQILIEKGFAFTPEMQTRKKPPTEKDIDSAVDKLNKLAIEFQSQLSEKLGAADFKKINGDKSYYKPIDPKLARKAMDLSKAN
jgi:hypothetical protein